jgi:hypothetical protein
VPGNTDHLPESVFDHPHHQHCRLHSNAIRHFPIKEFETWAAMQTKRYPLLKIFIHEAYTCRLTALSLRKTAGQLGYIANQNMFNVLNIDAPNVDTDNNATTVTQTTAAATTKSTLSSMYAATMLKAFPAEVITESNNCRLISPPSCSRWRL